MTTINYAEIESVKVTSSASLNLWPAAGGSLEPGKTDGQAAADAVGTSEAGRGETRRPDRKARQTQRRYTCPLDQSRNWLMSDPSLWLRRKVLKRATGAVYSVRQVYKSGRVELEKNWMTFNTDVATVRAQYEAFS